MVLDTVDDAPDARERAGLDALADEEPARLVAEEAGDEREQDSDCDTVTIVGSLSSYGVDDTLAAASRAKLALGDGETAALEHDRETEDGVVPRRCHQRERVLTKRVLIVGRPATEPRHEQEEGKPSDNIAALPVKAAATNSVVAMPTLPTMAAKTARLSG